MKVPCGVLTVLSLVYGAEARCSPTSYYKNCWIRRYPGVFIDVEESQRRGGQVLQSYQEDSALKCSRSCCLTRNFSCNLAIFHYDTVQENANCYHLHCPTLESCILTHRGNFVLYNITKGVDPDLLVFGKYFTSNLRVLPHLYTRINASEPLASDKRQFNRPLRQPAPPVTPAASGRTSTAATRTTATANPLRTPVQPTTFPTTLTPPTALSHHGRAPDPVTDSPRSQMLQSVPSHPIPTLTPTITTTTTTSTSNLSLDQTPPLTDVTDLSAETPQISGSPTTQHTTSTRPNPTFQTSSPSPQPGTHAPATAPDSSGATTATSAATTATPIANGDGGGQHAAANATLGVRNHTAQGNGGQGRPWINGGDGQGGTEWQARTLLVVVATCATLLLSCCCGVLLVLGLRGRRRRKGRYQTAWRGRGGSMRLIKYVLIREGS